MTKENRQHVCFTWYHLRNCRQLLNTVTLVLTWRYNAKKIKALFYAYAFATVLQIDSAFSYEMALLVEKKEANTHLPFFFKDLVVLLKNATNHLL